MCFVIFCAARWRCKNTREIFVKIYCSLKIYRFYENKKNRIRILQYVKYK